MPDGSSNLSGGAYGAMAEWLKAGVCKTFGEIPRQFESGSHLLYIIGDYIMDIKRVKKVIANLVAITVIVLFGIILFVGETNPTMLQGGDIQHAIDTSQDK